MISSVSPIRYGASPGLKKFATSFAHGVLISWPTVGGKAIRLAAKMTGITPAMFTRSGR